MSQPKERDWLNGYKNKTHIHAVYKRSTSDLRIRMDLKVRRWKKVLHANGNKRKVVSNNHIRQNRFFFFGLFRAIPMAYGSYQTRGQIRAIAAGLGHSHSNTRSEANLQATPHLIGGSLTHWARPGIEPASSWILVGVATTEPQQNLSK